MLRWGWGSRRRGARLALAVTLGGTLLAAWTGSTGATVNPRPATRRAHLHAGLLPLSGDHSGGHTGGRGPERLGCHLVRRHEIRAHWFPVACSRPDRRYPTVLMGPGWSLPGDTDTQGTGHPRRHPDQGSPGRRLQRAHLGSPWLRPVGRPGRGGQPRLRGPRREHPDQLGGHPARGPARRTRRSPHGHGGRVLRRRHPAGHRGHRLPGRRHRARPSPGTRWSPASTRPTRPRSAGRQPANLGEQQRPRRPGSTEADAAAQPDRGHHPGRAGLVRRPGAGLTCRPHPHPHPHRPGHGRHAVHPAGGGRQLRDPPTQRCSGGHAVVLRRARGLPDPAGQPAAAGERHPGLAQPVREAGHLGCDRPWVPVRRPERAPPTRRLPIPLPAGRAGHRRPAAGPSLWPPREARDRRRPRANRAVLARPGGAASPRPGPPMRSTWPSPFGNRSAGGGRRTPADPHLPGHLPGRDPAHPGLRPAGRPHDRTWCWATRSPRST